MSKSEAQRKAEEKFKQGKKRVSLHFTNEEFEKLRGRTVGINRVQYIRDLVNKEIEGGNQNVK